MSNTTPRDELREKIRKLVYNFDVNIKKIERKVRTGELSTQPSRYSNTSPADYSNGKLNRKFGDDLEQLVNAEVCQVLEKAKSEVRSTVVDPHDRNYVIDKINQILKRYGTKEEHDNGK